ncbi:prolipoprotein diacylglyceryl transferase [Christensenellaceae bacterium NSJ-63]|uniref:Phosphatidylglycerol--prolipoprotein diacylglyceryl transferase n=1 Tax=Guopingia tenuis TaxID=2763656 RepID=A0A926DFC2_9FIRM|nr:prolipoprotein diacylglyceryl transferase [Guopingia tenuis]MBC8537623.1 prolipoprotein diacylglyceryl transferase [Guopingia tenuis]MBS5644577.1 prolipoprotein diacylglyceryl transferase [Clostridiales bacterium]
MIDPIAVHNLFGIEGLNIAWYAIIVTSGIVAGILLGGFLAKKKGYTFEMLIDLMLLALPMAIVFARLYYVIFEWERYAGDFMKIIAIWEGGLAIYGGVIGALLAALIFSKWKKVPFGDILDIGAPGLILGQAIGRWGNFVNQEAFGNVITNPSMQWFPYGVYIERLGEWHQATFFYESAWNLIVLAVLLWYWKRAKHKGNVFVMYLVMYGIGRFFIEGLRTDSLWLVPGVIRVSQLLSAVLVIGGIIYLAVMYTKPAKIREYTGKYRIVPAAAAAGAASAQAETAEESETSSEDLKEEKSAESAERKTEEEK